jgi:tRNA U34 2-thiouridine synthase MnmA/TrmU
MAAEKIKAVGMLSGGLDSTLAAALVKRQGVEVRGVNFSTGFCVDDHKRAGIRNDDRQKPKRHEALRAGSDLEVPVEIIDVSKEYQDVVTRPKYGYGSAMNPCIDCRIFMFRRAKRYMEDVGARFIFTGEVLGQRPMSQHRRALDIVARDSGLEGYLVRPLSARLLPPTEPEKRGWLDREQLGDISGRSRKKQMELAERLGVADYPQPAGGCCALVDENFARKLEDLWEAKGEKSYTVEEALLLKVGRHLRLSPRLKLIVGRDEGESRFLERYAEGRTLLRPASRKGATALAEGEPTGEEILSLASIVAFYSGERGEPEASVECVANGASRTLEVKPAGLEWIDTLRI